MPACLAGRESSLMLRVGEVEQASVERLNNCINIGGSLRTYAYTARGVGGYSTVKPASLTFNALP